MKLIILKIVYAAMVVFGLFGVYTFIFVSQISTLKRIMLVVVAIGIILTGISGFLNSKKTSK